MEKNNVPQCVETAFTADNKANTFQYLLNSCECSETTLRRKIKQIGLIVSYNFNSKFYTLPTIASFNEHGIWDWQGIYFSIHGSLVKTLRKLIDDSKAGCTPAELSSILFVRVNDLLRVQSSRHLIRREKAGRTYVYYSSDDTVFSIQHRERQLLLAGPSLPKGTSVIDDKHIVIAILVEIILGGNLCEEAIGRRLKAKSVDVGTAEIQAVVSHYGLKKTIHKS